MAEASVGSFNVNKWVFAAEVWGSAQPVPVAGSKGLTRIVTNASRDAGRPKENAWITT